MRARRKFIWIPLHASNLCFKSQNLASCQLDEGEMEPRVGLAPTITGVAIRSLSALRYAALAGMWGVEPPCFGFGDRAPPPAHAHWCLDVGSNHGRADLQPAALPLSYPSIGSGSRIRTYHERINSAPRPPSSPCPNNSEEWLQWLESNQRVRPYEGPALPLSYTAMWSGRQDLNLRPDGSKPPTLPTELLPENVGAAATELHQQRCCRGLGRLIKFRMVRMAAFWRTASGMSMI